MEFVLLDLGYLMLLKTARLSCSLNASFLVGETMHAGIKFRCVIVNEKEGICAGVFIPCADVCQNE